MEDDADQFRLGDTCAGKIPVVMSCLWCTSRQRLRAAESTFRLDEALADDPFEYHPNAAYGWRHSVFVTWLGCGCKLSTSIAGRFGRHAHMQGSKSVATASVIRLEKESPIGLSAPTRFFSRWNW